MTVLVLFPHFLSGYEFGYGHDLRQQHFPFFEEFRRIMLDWIKFENFPNVFQEDSLPFYSWNLFLGNNFFASKSYYVVGDIYNYIFLPFHKLSYFDIRLLQTILRIFMAAGSMFLYLRKTYKKQLPLIVGSLAYAFSFWVFFYMIQPMFHSFYSFVPLYFLGMEAYLQDKKKILFIVMTTVLLFTNYYLFYTISFFSVFYYIYRYYCLEKKWENFVKETSILIGYYFIGVLMAMIMILPTIYYITGNGRVGVLESSLFYPFETYLYMVQSFFAPGQDNAFLVGNYRYDEIALWSGTIVMLLVPQILNEKDFRFRKATTILYTILILMFVILPGSSLFHGLSEANFRWLFLLVMMNIFVACRYLENPQVINKKNLIITATIGFLVNIVLTPILMQINVFSGGGDEYLGKIWFAISIVITSYILIKKSKHWKSFVLVMLCIDILVCSPAYRRQLGPMYFNEAGLIEKATQGIQTPENKEFLQFLRVYGEPVDKLYFRTLISYNNLYWSYSLNTSVFNELRDLMTYDSTVSPSIFDLKNFSDMDFFEEKEVFLPEWKMNFRAPDLVNFLNVKYAILVEGDKLPHENYEFIGMYNEVSVYRNLDALPLGTTYSSVVTYHELKERDENKLSALLKWIIVESEEDKLEIEENLKDQKRESFVETEYGGNRFRGYITTEDESFIVIQLPYDEGWIAEVNGEKRKIYRVNGGFMGVALDAGENTVDMYFVPKGFIEGSVLSGIGLVLFVVVVIEDGLKKKKRRGALYSKNSG